MILPTIYDATLDGIAADAKIGAAIASASERIAIDEAPTVTLNVLDPAKELLRSRLWSEPREAPLTLKLGDRSYGLVQVDKQQARELRLVFEQIEVLKLRAQQGYIKAYRSRTTRLAFCARLCREAGVDFHAPESGPNAPEFQPASGAAVRTGGGFDKGAGVTVKGAPASAAQLSAMEAVLGEAFGEHAPERAVIAVVMCVTQESTWNPKAGISSAAGDLERGHLGLFQQSPRFYPNPLDPVIATREFLKRFLPTYRANLSSTTTAHGLAALIESVQRSGLDPAATYERWYDESARTVAAFARPGPHRTLLLNDKFEFSRGQPHRPETSWDALGRILSEIGWRRFMVGRTLWATSDEWLMATPARATLTEDTGAVETISWSLDVGKPVDRASVAVDNSWVYAPGVTIRLEDEGPATGKWLLAAWERDLLGVSGTLSLVKPGRTIPEPVGDQSGKGYKPQPAGSGSLGKPGDISKGINREQFLALPPRDKIAAWCRWAISHASQVKYRQSRPIPLADVFALPIITDCSGFATMAYAAAGAPDPNGLGYSGQGFTGTMLRHLRTITRSEAQIGDLVVFGPYPGVHVVVIVELGDDPLTASHGGPNYDDPPHLIRMSAEGKYHAFSATTWLSAGIS